MKLQWVFTTNEDEIPDGFTQPNNIKIAKNFDWGPPSAPYGFYKCGVRDVSVDHVFEKGRIQSWKEVVENTHSYSIGTRNYSSMSSWIAEARRRGWRVNKHVGPRLRR